MRRIQGADIGPANTYKERNPATNDPGTKVADDALNDIQEELARGIESAGDVVDVTDYESGTGDRDQVFKGVAHYGAGGASFYIEDAGSVADAYVVIMPTLGVLQRNAPSALFDGMRCVVDIADQNTGAGTLQTAGHAAKSYKLKDNTNPPAGGISGRTTFEYNLSFDAWVILESDTGAVQIDKSHWPTISNNGGAPTTDLDFSAGKIPDSLGLRIIDCPALTKQLDNAWLAGDNQGGMFTGAGVAINTTYHCVEIVKDSDGSVDAGFDIDPALSNIPAGYSVFRRVHDIETDGTGAIKPFVQTGDYMQYVNLQTIVSTAAPSTSSVLVQAAPTGPKKKVDVYSALQNSVNTFISISSPDEADVAAGANTILRTQANGQLGTIRAEFITDNLGRIRYVSDTGSVSGFEILAHGWTDARTE